MNECDGNASTPLVGMAMSVKHFGHCKVRSGFSLKNKNS